VLTVGVLPTLAALARLLTPVVTLPLMVTEVLRRTILLEL
jgi:hypothetical protein